MSKIELSPYVNFQGRAREAMEFYHRVLGGKLDLQTLTEQGTAQPAGPDDRIAHARLEVDGALIIATDGHPKYPAKVGENLAIVVSGTDRDRLTTIFNALAEGGQLKGPLARQPWGSDVGWLADRFGINWTISIDDA
jgi:PhnB protein